ncbi:MAG: methyltransferase [Cyclobacteriaceae bacterium]|nr:methyltransferase [Cyclobacteriaceae bacterium]
MPNPYFSFKHFTIRQEHAAMKVTTDACLLGAYAAAGSPDHMLDIGTGTGILTIMLAQRYGKASIEGIEPDQAAADQARRNVDACPWKDRIRIKSIRIQDYIKNILQKFDLILCNPPYHKSHLISSDERANLARHSTDLTFDSLSFAVDKLISEKGLFYVIVPPRQYIELEKELLFFGLRPVDKLLIYNLPARPVYRVIGGFSRIVRAAGENTLLIRNEQFEYTGEYKELLKDFYLGF